MPRVVEAKPGAAQGTAGTKEAVGSVAVSFDAGELLLKSEAGEFLRLTWSADVRAKGVAKTRPLACAVPAGTYACVNYRIVREVDGVCWHLSGTGPELVKVEVKPGERSVVQVDPAIHFDLDKVGQKDKPFLGSAVQGHAKCGLSVYREGRRIKLGYQLQNADGEVTSEGQFNYG